MRQAKIKAFAKQGDFHKLIELVHSTGKAQSTRGRRKRSGNTGGFGRIDIVSEQLCDDVIGYLGPTLEKHKGCTLIDFHPGACLFTRKVHEHLAPKQHILVEPDSVYYEPFIKPLLKGQDSKYHLAKISSATHPALRWEHAIRTQSDSSLLPDREPLRQGDPRLMQFDPSLLVIGNLARQPRAQSVNVHWMYHNLTTLVLNSMARDLLSKRGLFEAGLVRMLWWLPDTAKMYRVGVSIPSTRMTHAVLNETAFDVSEVAGVESVESFVHSGKAPFTSRHRLAVLDLAASRQVAARMKQAGMKVPDGRALLKGDAYNSADDKGRRGKTSEPETKGRQNQMLSKKLRKLLSPFDDLAKDPRSLNTKVEDTAARLEELAPVFGRLMGRPREDKEAMKAALKTVGYPQCHDVEANRYSNIPTTEVKASHSKRVVFVDLALRLVNLEASLTQLEEGNTTCEHRGTEQEERRTEDRDALLDLRSRINQLNKDFNNLLDRSGKDVARHVGRFLDDQIAYFSTPQLLSWDRRAYEPLQASPEDFFPHSSISLMDFVPKAVDFSVPGLADSQESATVAGQIIATAFGARKTPVPAVLERIGVNAGKDLVAQVPAITDARRGGRLDPMELKVRMLTPEMIKGLVRAWFEWPFRPQTYELALAAGEGGEGSKEVTEKKRKKDEIEDEGDEDEDDDEEN